MDVSKTEEEVLRLWRELNAFERQLELTRGSKTFNFYDGPPFGTTIPRPRKRETRS
jgi:isoleucyl-tRNA synthetase